MTNVPAQWARGIGGVVAVGVIDHTAALSAPVWMNGGGQSLECRIGRPGMEWSTFSETMSALFLGY